MSGSKSIEVEVGLRVGTEFPIGPSVMPLSHYITAIVVRSTLGVVGLVAVLSVVLWFADFVGSKYVGVLKGDCVVIGSYPRSELQIMKQWEMMGGDASSFALIPPDSVVWSSHTLAPYLDGRIQSQRFGGWMLRSATGRRVVFLNMKLAGVVICLFTLAIVIARIVRTRLVLNRAAPRCWGCEYDLTGNLSGRCPECGKLAIARATKF